MQAPLCLLVTNATEDWVEREENALIEFLINKNKIHSNLREYYFHNRRFFIIIDTGDHQILFERDGSLVVTTWGVYNREKNLTLRLLDPICVDCPPRSKKPCGLEFIVYQKETLEFAWKRFSHGEPIYSEMEQAREKYNRDTMIFLDECELMERWLVDGNKVKLFQKRTTCKEILLNYGERKVSDEVEKNIHFKQFPNLRTMLQSIQGQDQ